MSGAHEKLERAEHASHAGGHHSSNNKLFGLTMALIGVLIAFCAALVGSERNELTKTMIKQTQAHSDFTAASTKYRLIMIELEKQHARVASARDTPGGWSPVQRFVELAADYGDERNLSKKWADTYEPLVEAHFDAAEGYEHAQLIAEIGIVMASLGVCSPVEPLVGFGISLDRLCSAGWAHLSSHPARCPNCRVADQPRRGGVCRLRKAHVGANEDEQTVEHFDADGKIRAARLARMSRSSTEAPSQNEKQEAAKE
jgi:hypothetical protein